MELDDRRRVAQRNAMDGAQVAQPRRTVLWNGAQAVDDSARYSYGGIGYSSDSAPHSSQGKARENDSPIVC